MVFKPATPVNSTIKTRDVVTPLLQGVDMQKILDLLTTSKSTEILLPTLLISYAAPLLYLSLETRPFNRNGSATSLD